MLRGRHNVYCLVICHFLCNYSTYCLYQKLQCFISISAVYTALLFQIETVKQKAAEAQDVLAQVTRRYEAQINEKFEDINKCLQLENENISKKLLQLLAEKKNLREHQPALQNDPLNEKEKSESSHLSTIKRLQDESKLLRVANMDSDNQLKEYTTKFESQWQIEQKLKYEQNVILQELAEIKKHIDTLKEMLDKVQNENQEKEKTIQDLQNALKLSNSELDEVKQQQKHMKVSVY